MVVLTNFCFILVSLKAKILRLLACQNLFSEYIIALNLLKSHPPLLPMELIAASYRLTALIHFTFILDCYQFHLTFLL